MQKQFNYSYLRGFVKEHYKSNERFAKFLGIGINALYERLANKVPFTQREIYKVTNEAIGRKLTADEVELLFFNIY